jgi:hypothetical protein
MPKVLTAAEQEAIRRLAADLPALWHADTTTAADRKGILRQILDQVVLQIEGQSEWVEARLHWAGGHQTYTRFRRPVGSLAQLSAWPQIQKRILALRAQGRTAQEIADQLNREGRTTPHHKLFTAATIRNLVTRCGMAQIRRGAENEPLTLTEDEWFIPDLAHKFGIRQERVYSWIRAGKLPAYQLDGPQGRWIVRANAATIESVRIASEQRCHSRARMHRDR